MGFTAMGCRLGEGGGGTGHYARSGKSPTLPSGWMPPIPSVPNRISWGQHFVEELNGVFVLDGRCLGQAFYAAEIAFKGFIELLYR